MKLSKLRAKARSAFRRLTRTDDDGLVLADEVVIRGRPISRVEAARKGKR